MPKTNLDLAELLPKQYRNRTLTTLIRALFNNHLSKDESVLLYGFVGSEAKSQPTDIYLRESDLERQANQLSPVLYSKQGVEEKLVTWRELVQRLVLLGVPYDSLSEWLNVEALNLVPFIDLDKFANFDEYVWVGSWVVANPTLPWASLGIPAAAASSALNSFNPQLTPDYYVIARGSLALDSTPTPPYPGLSTWSDWALGNMWVHKADATEFQIAHPILSSGDLIQAIRPILEFESNVKLSLYYAGGEPADTGTLLVQTKTSPNQLPLFDLYYHDGSHSSYISSGFYYQEAADQPVDSALGRRIVRDAAADLVFGHSFTSPTDDQPLFLKTYNGSSFSLTSPWRGLSLLSQEFVKYETSGALINPDKLQNFESYYWTGSSEAALPAYNPLSEAEYVVIEASGASGWALDNRWRHASTLSASQKLQYLQAQQPIIEFNGALESELLTSKTSQGELPKFKIWALNEATGTYVEPLTLNSRLTDGYTYGTLFANLDSLEVTGKGIAIAAEQANLLAKVRGFRFAQSLLTGYYDNNLDASAYSYSARVFERLGSGDGQLSVFSLDTDAVPQVIELSGNDDGVSFNVQSTVYGTLPTLTAGSTYSVGGASFTVVPGTLPFDHTTRLRFDIRSAAFKRINLYVKLNGSYRTVTTPLGYTTNSALEDRQVAVNPLVTAAGAWKCPTPIFGNLDSTISSTFKQGDLYSHFVSIIAAQPGLTGIASSRNNWRLLSKDFSRGGLIKTYNDRLSLLLGMLCQDAADPISLLEFGQGAYTSVISRTREFVENELVGKIVSGETSFLSGPGSLEPTTYRQLRSYLERQSAVVSASPTTVDDQVNMPFASSTLTLKALTLTAPYLGLAPRVQPKIAFDDNQNTAVLVHHDGHSSPLPTVDFSVLKRLVTKRFKRSDGQETAGFVGGPTPPPSPFARQLWLDLSGEKLYVFDAISDTGELPTVASHGQFSYDRLSGETWLWNGSWTSLGTAQASQEAPWRNLDLAATLTSLLLSLETELYSACPIVPEPFNTAVQRSSIRYDGLMKSEFEKFATKFGVADPYECSYDPENPFTWSYSGSGLGFSNQAAWQEVYREVYGTSRPDLHPYISCNQTEAAFINDLVIGGALPALTLSWDPSYWIIPAVRTLVKLKLSLLGKPIALSIDIATSQLLPPYSFGAAEELSHNVPPTPNRRFLFGELGPIERLWTSTTEYRTSMLKTYFRLDPLTFISTCWGDQLIRVSDYELVRPIGRKPHIADVLIHGEPINRTASSLEALTLTCNLAPVSPVTYTLEVASAKHDILRCSELDSLSYTFSTPGSIELGPYVTGTLDVPRAGLNLGDAYTISIDTLGELTVTLAKAPVKLEGLSQLYSHFHASKSFELSYSADKSKLTAWKPKLAYRFNTLVDTDVLTVKVEDAVIDSSGYNVYLKETELQTASWLTGFKLTLLQAGSTQQSNGKSIPAKAAVGQRGDDWIYRVDLTNIKHPALEWYQFDNIAHETFFALGSKSSHDEWKRFTNKVALQKMSGPFVVKGLQALVSFVFGYAERAAELGYKFNDENDPVIDPSTGRLTGWQLMIEQFIDSQFNEPENGSIFMLTPFKNRLWFNTSYGYVSDLSKTGSSSLIPGLYVADGSRVRKGAFRVFRDGSSASITSDEDLTGALLTTSIFEHVLLLEDKVGETVINDPFLNQHVSRLFLSGFKQATPTGRPVYGGKYLVGNQMRTNMEGSVQQLSNLYDISTLKSDALFDRASSLVSFDRKDYHGSLGTTLPTQLQFWRGMLKSKGTNRAVSSFVNSSLYRSALIDELWAYKVAEYGDIRRAVKVELNIRTDDMIGERANYLLLEPDEVSRVSELFTIGGYDSFPYDDIAYDMYTVYTDEQLMNMDLIDPRGCIIVRPDDETRWNSFSDLGSISSIKAVILGTEIIVPNNDGLYTVHDSAGHEVLADCFELVDIDSTSFANAYSTPVLDITSYMKSGSKIYRETGDYIAGTAEPIQFGSPKFKRVNAGQLQILDPALYGKRLLVVAYGPPLQRFSPSQLYRDEGGRDTPINGNVIWWDPARGVHSPQAHSTVDIKAVRDPAKYNVTSLNYKALTADNARAWGKEQVGMTWWNTENAGWMRYHDVKLYEDHNTRLAQWGGLADWASIDLCEWVEAEQPPTAYTGTGEVGVQNYLTRSRTWWQRPVVWLYSANAQASPKAPLKKQTATLELIGDYLVATDAPMPKFEAQERVASMKYETTARVVLSMPAGCIEVASGDISLRLGSAASFTVPVYAATPNFTNFEVSALPSTSQVTIPFGALKLDWEGDDAGVYIRATAGSLTQRLSVDDTPVKAGTRFELEFELIGIKLSATCLHGHADAWTVGVLTQQQRAEQAGIELGNGLHDIVIRQQVEVKTLIDPGVTTLPGIAVSSTYGWVSWKMPTYQLTSDDLDADFGSWSSLPGEYSLVTTSLVTLKAEIQNELLSPQPTRQYDERWGAWKTLVRSVNLQTYFPTSTLSHLQNLASLAFDVSADDAARISLYVNGVKILRGASLVHGASGYFLNVDPASIVNGSKLRAELQFRIPTTDELNLKLEGTTQDPTKLVEFKLDMPHVKVEERNEFGRISKTRYYYWVKHKETAAIGKKLSIKLAAEQLAHHNGPYAVPQALKRFNQLDGRPNRYAMLSVVDMTRLVRKDSKYKLRLTENGAMRDDDNDISLRPAHSEWKLIRKNQPTRIPKELWDKLVDTMCGETATGQPLPYGSYAEYDSRNNTTSRIGLKLGQVLSDSSQAVLTVKGTLAETQVVSYDIVKGSFSPAPVNFIGYDPKSLDTYLASPTTIRAFMASLWNYADSRNINELFFAVLEDSFAASYELADIIKTSFITLDEVRTVVIEG